MRASNWAGRVSTSGTSTQFPERAPDGESSDSRRRPVRPAERAPPGTKQRGIGSCRFARLVEASHHAPHWRQRFLRCWPSSPLLLSALLSTPRAATTHRTHRPPPLMRRRISSRRSSSLARRAALTQSNLTDAESLAEVAESYGMDVRRVFFPHATWDERAGQHPGREPRRVHGPWLRLAERHTPRR